MNIKHQIKSLLQEANIYHTQGLLSEAKGKYTQARELINHHDQIPNRQKLLEMIAVKISTLQKNEEILTNTAETAEVAPEVQDLIQNLFSFSGSDDPHTATIEGAVNLAKFGQYGRALTEFNELLKVDSMRVSAAKNIIRCHIARSSIDDAVAQFQQWQTSNLFIEPQLEKVRHFLEGILDKKGMSRDLTRMGSLAIKSDSPMDDDDIIDISTIGIKLSSGSFRGREVEFDVNFQSGNVLSIIVSSKDKELIENFKVGLKLNEVTYYSPVAIFKGCGVVKVKSTINSGPKRGDYNLDIKIEGV